MTAVDWARVRPILQGALDLPAEERERHLEAVCAGDRELLELVRRLLAEELGEDGFLEPPVERSKPPEGWVPAVGARVGAYRLAERLGAGGMGEVWLAEREGVDFRQRVAIKVVKRGMDTDEVLRRFRRERKVLAELSHPGIPRLIDGGATPDGRPYMVMEHVQGTPIDVFAQGLELQRRLELLLAVCETVQHAHGLGVVHRDLKPANILVTEAGEPKLLDFGIAKVLDPDEAFGTVERTLTGRQLLTPRYAAPEQLRGGQVTTATDVYALGLLCWELLVGRPAVRAEALTRADLEEAVCELPVPRPSHAVEPTQTGLRRALAGDLDTICSMALRKEPERRYASAQQLADDLRRHLKGLPVLARPDTMTYRVSKFVRRNRPLVGGVIATIVVLVIGLVATMVQYGASRRAEREARRTAYAAKLSAAEAALLESRIRLAREHLETAPEELRGWEWEHLVSRLDHSLSSYPPSQAGDSRVAWFEDGRTLARSGYYHLVVLRDGQELYRRESCYPTSLHAEPGGSRLAWGDLAGGLWVADPEVGDASVRCLIERQGQLEGLQDALHVAWRPGGGLLAFSTRDGAVRIVDAGSGAVLQHFREHDPSERGGRLAWHPGGELLVSAGWDETVQVYDATSGASLGGWRAHTMSVEDVDFDADGRLLLTASVEGTVKVWEFETRRELAVLRPHLGPVMAARFLPGGERIVSTCEGAIHVTSWRSEEVVGRWLGHEQRVQDLALHEPSGLLATASLGEGVRVWDADTQDVRHLQTCEYTALIRVNEDGSRMVTGSPDGVARVWDSATLELRLELTSGEGRICGTDWSSDGTFIATCTTLGRIDLWDAVTGTLESRAEGAGVATVAFDPLGSVLWTVTHGWPRESTVVRSWSLPDLQLASEVRLAPTAGHSSDQVLALEGGGLLVACASAGSLFRVDDSGAVPLPALEPVHCIAAEGELLVFAHEATIRLLDRSTMEERARWPTPDRCSALAVHPSAPRLALAQQELIEIWDTEAASRVATLHGHRSLIEDLCWTPDGRTLLSVGQGGQLFLWESR